MARVGAHRGSALADRPVTIFVHIHKTAGMSLRGLFAKEYLHAKHFNTCLADVCGPEWEACQEKIRRLSPEERASYGVFKGHMPFGLHELIDQPCRYITFLREPVSRVVSYYRMAIRKGQLPDDHEIDPAQANWNLGACPQLLRAFDNGQTRVLSGVEPRLPFGACTARHLAAAKENIDRHFDFVGVTEQFDLSLVLLQSLFAWKMRFYVPDNVAPKDKVVILPKILEAIRQLNSLDGELYRHAERRLRELEHSQGWKLQARLRVYTVGKEVHQWLHEWRQARKARRGEPRRPGCGR